jgi:chromate transport protein ChrA
MDRNMDESKERKQRLGLTIVISAGATYILSALVGALLLNSSVTLTMPMVHGIKLVIFLVVGFAVWNILKQKGQMPKN